MKKQILDLAEVRVGQVLKVVKPSGNITFWIIKSSKGAEVTQEYLEKRYIKNKPDLVNFINQFGLTRLDVVEFNEHSTKWGMTINTKTSDKFFSVNDSDYVFSFYKSSLKEARKYLAEKMKKELHVVVENAMTAIKESLDRYTKSFAATFVQA